MALVLDDAVQVVVVISLRGVRVCFLSKGRVLLENPLALIDVRNNFLGLEDRHGALAYVKIETGLRRLVLGTADSIPFVRVTNPSVLIVLD